MVDMTLNLTRFSELLQQLTTMISTRLISRRPQKKGGPREPWHDIHCRLEGSAAWDVLINFEQRWIMQGTNNNLLIDVQDSTKFIPRSNDFFPDDNHETWNVQVFRSIDSEAATGYPDSTSEAAAAAGLISGKDAVIDRSIQDAYIHAIRRAKRFIYIENQYFIGSAFDWKEKKQLYGDITAYNLIPKELSLKIVSKIEKGERFTVYMVLPMWPEGVPCDFVPQDILYWQRETMEMMYTDVINALRAQKSKSNPEDYLLFLCLGNREVKMVGEYEPSELPNPHSDYIRAQTNRRFMIYVHSKMIIGKSLIFLLVL